MPRSAHAQTFEATSLTACVIVVVRVYEASRLSFVTFACRCIFVVGMGGVASTLPLLKLRPLCRLVSVTAFCATPLLNP